MGEGGWTVRALRAGGSMALLNEAASRYPGAISFVAGRPPDEEIAPERIARWLERFVTERAGETGRTPAAVRVELGQYGDTNGMIATSVARWLRVDEGLDLPPGAIGVTNGFQEALLVTLLGLLDPGRDAVLAPDPGYVGLAGAAELVGVPVFAYDAEAPLVDAVAASLRAAVAAGRRPRALHVMPDYANPTGRLLDGAERRAILAYAQAEGLAVLEDIAYRAFCPPDRREPTIASLDDDGLVVLLGSFAKVFLPGVRLGFLASQGRTGDGRPLAEGLAPVKSYVSVLTSPLAQAILGGALAELGYSLRDWAASRARDCDRRRAALLRALARAFPAGSGVRWTEPDGGFFVVVSFPFPFDLASFDACARDHGVLVAPMALFSDRPAFASRVRLAISNVPDARIDEGVARLAAFVASAG